jgi:hypothetical protein
MDTVAALALTKLHDRAAAEVTKDDVSTVGLTVHALGDRSTNSFKTGTSLLTPR